LHANDADDDNHNDEVDEEDDDKAHYGPIVHTRHSITSTRHRATLPKRVITRR